MVDIEDYPDTKRVHPIDRSGNIVGGPDSPLVTSPGGGGSVAAALTHDQNALSTTAEEVIPANTARKFASVRNIHASIDVYLGKSDAVTTANGYLLRPGEAFEFEGYTGAIWAIAVSGTPTVCFVEW